MPKLKLCVSCQFSVVSSIFKFCCRERRIFDFWQKQIGREIKTDKSEVELKTVVWNYKVDSTLCETHTEKLKALFDRVQEVASKIRELGHCRGVQ